MTGERRDLYAALGLTSKATQEEVRRAYLALVRQNHPDTRPCGDPFDDTASDIALEQALSAYTVLGDPARRHRYDQGTIPHQTSTSIQVRVVRHSSATRPDRPPIQAGPMHWHRPRQ
jgi:DnaJ-class molecular chaperone